MGIAEVVLALAKVFIMIFPGYLLSRLGMIKKQHTEAMTLIITTVTYPCLVIDAMQMEYSTEVINNCKVLVVLFFAIISISLIISKLVVRFVNLPPAQSNVLAFMMTFGNTGFLGLPVLNGLFGKEAVFYGALCDSTFDLLMMSVGVALIRMAAAGETKINIKEALKSFINPCFIGVIIGLILYVCKITLPAIVGGPVASIGAVTSPLAMMVVGSHLGRIRFRELFTNKYAYLICVLKLLLAPAMAILLVKIFLGLGSLFTTVIILESAMPCAMFAVILSERYKADVEFATKGVMMTTFVSLITIPLVAIAIQYL